MREVNFLPTWYPKIVRQKQVLRAQAWITVIAIVTGGCLLLAAHRSGVIVSAELQRSQARAQQMIKAVNQLDEMLDLQKQLIAKQAIVGELGLPVELSRVLAEMGSCTPREVTFTDVVATTVERAPITIADRAAAMASGRGDRPTRQIELRLHGIAPTEGEVTTFWSRLIQRPCMSQVRLVNSNEKIDGDHKMREFEITLNISLDPQEAS